MEFKQKAVIHNRFDVEVRDAKTNELADGTVAYNYSEPLVSLLHKHRRSKLLCRPLKAIGFEKETVH